LSLSLLLPLLLLLPLSLSLLFWLVIPEGDLLLPLLLLLPLSLLLPPLFVVFLKELLCSSTLTTLPKNDYKPLHSRKNLHHPKATFSPKPQI